MCERRPVARLAQSLLDSSRGRGDIGLLDSQIGFFPFSSGDLHIRRWIGLRDASGIVVEIDPQSVLPRKQTVKVGITLVVIGPKVQVRQARKRIEIQARFKRDAIRCARVSKGFFVRSLPVIAFPLGVCFPRLDHLFHTFPGRVREDGIHRMKNETIRWAKDVDRPAHFLTNPFRIAGSQA